MPSRKNECQSPCAVVKANIYRVKYLSKYVDSNKESDLDFSSDFVKYFKVRYFFCGKLYIYIRRTIRNALDD